MRQKDHEADDPQRVASPVPRSPRTVARRKTPAAPTVQGEERLENIRRVVLELIADHGIEGVTIDKIAATAQASKQTLYKRWPTKTELVRDAVRASFGGNSPGDLGDLGDLREELRLILEAAADMLKKNGRLIIALIDGAQRDPTVMAIMRQETRDNFRESLQRPLKRAMARGEIGPETDLDLITEVALPMLLHRAMMGEVIDSRVVLHILDDVVMKLMSPPAKRK